MSVPDYPLGQTLDFKFTTRNASGVPTTLSGSPAVEVYEDNSTTQIAAAETLTVDFDSVTGLNNLRVVATSGNGFESGKSYQCVISSGTVDSVSVVGEVVAQFSVERSPALRPTTAGRTLTVESDGMAHADVKEAAGTAWNSGAIGPNTLAADTITAAKIAADAIGASELAADAVTEIQSGLATASAQTTAQNDLDIITGTAGVLIDAGTGTGQLDISSGKLAWNSAWDAEVQSEVNDGLVAFWTSPATLVDLVWDEVLTGATHNVATSAGRRLRDITSNVIRTGTAQGGASISITLDSGASASDGAYDPARISIVGGTGIGQTRLIVDYVGSTKVATVDRTWRTNPDNTSEFVITGTETPLHVNEGIPQASTNTSITLNSDASATDDSYNGQTVWIRAGVGEDQVRLITDYDGGTKVATVAEAWATNPTTGSVYAILPIGRVEVDTITDGAKTDIRSAVGLVSANLDTQLAAIDNFVDTEIAAIIAELAKVPKSDGSVSWNATALAAIEAECEDALQLTIPDTVPSVGSRPSVQQAVRIALQALTAKDYTGTTFTVYKEDNSTTLVDSTMDDATNPTNIVRAN